MIWRRIKNLWWLSGQDFSNKKQKMISKTFGNLFSGQQAKIIEIEDPLDKIKLD